MHAYNFHINAHDLVLLGTLFVAGTFVGLLWFKESIYGIANRFLALALASAILHLFWALVPLVCFYSLKIRRPLKQFYQRQKFEGGDRHRGELRWLDRQILGFGILWLLWLLGLDIVLAVMTVWMAAAAYLREEADENVQKPSEGLREKGIWLKKTVKANGYYQDPELTLSSLAEKLDMNPHELSRIINKSFKKNFHDFVNELRVAEIIRKMKDPANDQLTLLGIAFDSGFNSKSTFNRTFKQMTSKTPVEYKNDLKNKRPIYHLTLYSDSPGVISHLKSMLMFKNYILLAWRHLGKNLGYTCINIAGLSIGMAIAIVIGLWINDEATFDHYAPSHSRLAAGWLNMRLNNAIKKGEFFTGETIMMPLGSTLSTKYKDLFSRVALTHPSGTRLFNYGEKTVSGISNTSQSDLPGMFGFRMLSGSADATKDPSTIIIAKSLATALFGNGDPLGKTIKVDNTLAYRIGGTFADLPKNTTFNRLQAVFPWGNAENGYHRDNTNWQDHNGAVYVELAPGVTAEQATARVKNLTTPYEKDFHEEVLIYPLDKAYLYSQFEFNKPVGGRITMVWLFGIIGAFVLFLACINFMNLATARSEKRAREVGIRKTIGSLRSQLIAQFLSESVLLTFIALCFALTLALTSLPFFNGLADKEMSIPWTNPLFIISVFCFTVFTGLLAGSYPAFYLSAFRPVKVLKGKVQIGKSATLPREILVVLQFTVSLILIIGTTIVYRQILFTKDRPIGYNREELFTVDMNTPDLGNHYEALRAELIQQGLAANVAASDMKPTSFEDGNSLDWAGKRPDQNTIGFNNVNITSDYGRTIGWTITRGRDLSRDFPTDSNAAILNEKAVTSIGFKDPIGQIVKLFDKPYTVVGVCADIVNNNPYDTAENEIFVGGRYTGEMIVKINPGNNPHKMLAAMARVFKKYNPSSPFIYKFVDEAYAAKFEADERIGNLAAVFAGLAIFISCLGLFGLAAFVAEQRTKEIGVRKVLGAGLLNLWGLLSREFLKLTALSILIGIPLAYYGMNKWIQGYFYHAPLSWWIFAAAALGLIAITLFTVSYQALKAALMNPVKSLRSE